MIVFVRKVTQFAHFVFVLLICVSLKNNKDDNLRITFSRLIGIHMDKKLFDHLEHLERDGDYLALIKEIRALVKADRTVFRHPFIKHWCGIRWRNIFLTEALDDKTALKKADSSKLLGRKDKRPHRQQLAETFLRGDEIREWQLELPPVEAPASIVNTTLVFSPGLLTGMLPVQAFQTAFPKIEKRLGIRILRSDSHPMRGCAANSADLLAAIERGEGFSADTRKIQPEDRCPPGDVVLIGYSKGAPDIYQLLVQRPDLKDRVRCIYNWGGAIGGSYLADDIYGSIKDLDIPRVEKALAAFLSVISPAIDVSSGSLRRIEEYNIKEAVYDLTTTAREAFLAEHKALLKSLDIPIFNITGSTTAMEVPYFQIQGVMALNRYDSNNDMQLTQSEAKLKVPMATDLAMVRAHHWNMSYDPFPKLMRFGSPHLDHPFPKEAAATAMVLLGVELGLID